MDNHVHLLVTPPTIGAVSRLMQQLGRQYVGQFNARHHRTGTLWEGRYKSCLVDSETYALRCLRYIDLNPIRACMTDDPAAFPWSSCAAHCGRREDPMLSLHHPSYRVLGTSADERAEAYRTLLLEVLADDGLANIRDYLQQQWAMGSSRFQAMVEAKTRPSRAYGRLIDRRKRGLK